MALFGLGSFGEGFVTGFADSAADAIQKDMDAVNARIEKLSDIQADRIIKEQSQRDEEIKEATRELEAASAVFGTDVNAKNYVASILRKEGSIEGLKSVIADFKAQKKNRPNLNIGSYFAQVSNDLPNLSYKDMATSIQPSATYTEVTLPEDVASAGAGRLLQGIGLGQDISGRVSKNVREQMLASGVSTDATTIQLPDIPFAEEKFKIDIMPLAGRIKYLTEELSIPEITPDRENELKGYLQEATVAAERVGDRGTVLNSIEAQISRLDVTFDDTGKPVGENAAQYEQLIFDRDALRYEIDLVEAGNNKEKVLRIKAEEARRLGNVAEATRLTQEADDLVMPPTFKIKQDRLLAIIEQKMSKDPTDPELPKLRGQLADIQEQAEKSATGDYVFSAAETNLAGKNILNSIKNHIMTSNIQDKYNVDPNNGMPIFKAGLKDAEIIKLKKMQTALTTEAIANQIALLDNPKEIQLYRDIQEQFIMSGRAYREILPDTDNTGILDTLDGAKLKADIIKGGLAKTNTIIDTSIIQSVLDDAKTKGFSEAFIAQLQKELTPAPEQGDIEGDKSEVPEVPEVPVVSEGVSMAAELLANKGPFAGNKSVLDELVSKLDITRKEAQELVNQAGAEVRRRKEDELRNTPSEKLSANKLLKNLKLARTKEEYETALAAYAQRSKIDEETIREFYPSPVQEKAKGGLMARQ